MKCENAVQRWTECPDSLFTLSIRLSSGKPPRKENQSKYFRLKNNLNFVLTTADSCQGVTSPLSRKDEKGLFLPQYGRRFLGCLAMWSLLISACRFKFFSFNRYSVFDRRVINTRRPQNFPTSAFRPQLKTVYRECEPHLANFKTKHFLHIASTFEFQFPKSNFPEVPVPHHRLTRLGIFSFFGSFWLRFWNYFSFQF